MIDRSDPKPLHLQIEDYIKNKVDSGEWGPNQAIPSENELCRIYGISRMTVRNAITKLVYEGLLYRVAGKGTFVNEQKIIAKSSYSGFRDQLEHLGPDVKTEIIDYKITNVSSNIASRFDLPIHYKFYIIVMRSIAGDKTPLSLHTTYIPEHLAHGLDKENVIKRGLQEIISEDFKFKPSKIIETLEEVNANKMEAEFLKVPEDNMLLLLNDFLYMGDIPYEFTKIVFRGDKIQLRFEFINQQ